MSKGFHELEIPGNYLESLIANVLNRHRERSQKLPPYPNPAVSVISAPNFVANR